ncbi:MAG: aminoglycoside phosphotransferase family protein [Acidimicrobiales bacterium]
MRIPETLEEASSAAWLSGVLGTEVLLVRLGEVDRRVSTNAPLHVELVDGSIRDLWVKGYFDDAGRPFRSAGVPEAGFYRELAATTGMRTLRAVFADADPGTEANALVTEDVLTQGAVFLDSLSAYSVDQAAESLDQLALLHSSTWLRGDAPWLDSRLLAYTERRGVADIASNLDGPIGALVPERVRDAQRLYDAYKVVAAEVATSSPWCVIHGDPHIGNVYLDGEGRPTFLDWQLVQRGPWYLDVGYHIASALTIDDRRRSEEDLVRHYLERLQARGVNVAPGELTWRGLRLGMMHGFYLWGITLKVRPERTSALLERLGTAVDDHDAFAQVGF